MPSYGMGDIGRREGIRSRLRSTTGREPTEMEIDAADAPPNVASTVDTNAPYSRDSGYAEPGAPVYQRRGMGAMGRGVRAEDVPIDFPQRGGYGMTQGAGPTADPDYTFGRRPGDAPGMGLPPPGTPATTRPPGTAPTNTAPAPPAPPPAFGTTPYTDRGSGTGSSKYNYTGFDFEQDPNNRLIGKSAKYSFAQATKEAAESGVGDIWKTKSGAQHFAENYIKPRLEQNGFEVLEIVGDKMRIRDYADRAAGRPGSWVDFVVNADGDNPALAWQVEQERSAFGTVESRAPALTNPPNVPAYTPPAASAASPSAMTADERAYRLLARREARLGRLGRGQREV